MTELLIDEKNEYAIGSQPTVFKIPSFVISGSAAAISCTDRDGFWQIRAHHKYNLTCQISPDQ